MHICTQRTLILKKRKQDGIGFQEVGNGLMDQSGLFNSVWCASVKGSLFIYLA